MKNILTATFFNWILRRMLELGGLFGVIAGILAQIDPTALTALFSTLGNVLTGNWGEVNLMALASALSLAGGLVWNAWTTFRNQVVVDGHKIPTKDLPVQKRIVVEEIAEAAVEKREKKPLKDRILESLKKRR